jgi:hypothetical protein
MEVQNISDSDVSVEAKFGNAKGQSSNKELSGSSNQ